MTELDQVYISPKNHMSMRKMGFVPLVSSPVLNKDVLKWALHLAFNLDGLFGCLPWELDIGNSYSGAMKNEKWKTKGGIRNREQLESNA